MNTVADTLRVGVALAADGPGCDAEGCDRDGWFWLEHAGGRWHSCLAHFGDIAWQLLRDVED